MVRSLLRPALCLALAVLFTGCTMFISRIHVQRAESEPAFTHAEREKAKVIALEICRAARFAGRASEPIDPAPSGYSEVFACDGRGSEQDTVSVSGQLRNGGREILVSLSDYTRADPLPATRKMLEDLRTALERAFPDARVEVTRNNRLRLFGP